MAQLGFVRISSTPNVLPVPTVPQAAAAVLGRWTVADDHHFWPADVGVAALAAVPSLVGHKQLTATPT